MIQGKSVLAVIPARGGSKGVPRKNLIDLGGKPLIAWTIEAAKGAKFIDRVVLSSEDEEILAIGRKLGCEIPYQRPPELATDDARTIEVLHELLKHFNADFDYVVQLQPTSPFRTSADIDAAIDLCIRNRAPACVSVSPAQINPHLIFRLTANNGMDPIMGTELQATRRQDLPTYYALNGAIYLAECDWISERNSFLSDSTIAYIMPCDHSLDIDTAEDILIAEDLINITYQNEKSKGDST